MKKRILINCLLFLSFFFLGFITIPLVLRSNFLSSGFSDKLSWYPLFGLFIIYLYEKYKYIKATNINEIVIPTSEKICLKYIMVYFIFVLVNIINGLYNYPYYTEILNGPINQIEKLPIVLNFLSNYGINVNPELFTKFWMLARGIKAVIFRTIYTFGFTYVMYYFINKKGWTESFNLLKKGVYLTLVFIFAYSIIELFYLMGNQTAAELLVKISPFFHDIKSGGSNWPPLLWKNQLRSIFAEPSFFGIYATLVTPMLWSNILDKKNKMFWLIISGFFTFFIFITQARTATLLFLGELFLLIVFLMYYYGEKSLKKLLPILGMSLFAFLLSANFCAHMPSQQKASYQQKASSQQKASYEYYEKNIVSVIGVKQRSNSSRYAVAIGNIKLGMDYPVMGVGYGLNSAYLAKYFPQKLVENNGEVKKWVNNMNEKGILKSPIPYLGDYTTRFAEAGLVGLILFLVPWLYVLILIPQKIKKMSDSEKNNIIGLYIALIASLVGGFSIYLTGLYICWTLLAFSYALIWNGKESVKELELK